jgi:hypothetical protein
MSNEPKLCTRGCSVQVYFDKNSPTGHPNHNTWIPLEMKEGRKTDTAHNCPKRNNGSAGTLDNTSTTATATTTTAIIVKPELLKTAETLIQILQDYVRLKLNEQRQGQGQGQKMTAAKF